MIRLFTYLLFTVFLMFAATLSLAQSPYAGKNKGGDNTINAVVLDSSNLPIVAMKLPYLWPPWDPIPDTPKVTVNMGIIDNGYNVMNHIGDSLNGYAGKIGIEKRGSISQAFWYLQKSYGLETRDIAGNDSDAVILSMPKEHDWILYAPFDDHTLMRNAMMYRLGSELGRWTPRSRFCEVQFYNWAWQPDYRGVYVMMEKIKRDKNRVNVSKLEPADSTGDALTGGYIFAVDKNIWAQDSGWKSPKDTGVFFSYKYPKADEITSVQKQYLKAYVDSFETAMQGANFADLNTGFRKYIDQPSFIDFFIMQEISKSVDAFRRSAYLYKDKKSKGGKLIAGPLWDFNSALYNAKLCTFEQDTGWAYQTVCWVNEKYHVPFWWGRMLQDTNYTRDLKCRWRELRKTTLDTGHIFKMLDSMANYISAASVRHFSTYSITATLKVQVDTLKWWLNKRFTWLDTHMPGKCTVMSGMYEGNAVDNWFTAYPNPTSGELTIDFYLSAEKDLSLELFDIYGRSVRQISKSHFDPGENKVQLDLSEYASGIYFLKLSGGGINSTRKIVYQK